MQTYSANKSGSDPNSASFEHIRHNTNAVSDHMFDKLMRCIVKCLILYLFRSDFDSNRIRSLPSHSVFVKAEIM